MRKTTITIIVLVLLTLGYAVWPFYDLYRFVGAVERGDVARVTRAVDFIAVRQSLAQQIVLAYLRRTGTRLNPLAQGAATAVAGSLADPMLARLMTPEAFIDFLKSGWPTAALPDAGPAGMAGISRNALGTAWQTFANSDYGFGRFDVVVPVTAAPDRQFNLRFRLSKWRWQLKAITLPGPVQDLLADELIKSMKAPSPPP